MNWLSHLLFIGMTVALSACGPEESVPKTAPAPHSQQDSPQLTESLPPETPPISRELFLDELSKGQWREMCAWMIAIQGGPHSVECGNGVTVTIQTVEECSAQSDFPHCTVQLLADCIRDQAKDLCAEASQACQTFYQCR